MAYPRLNLPIKSFEMLAECEGLQRLHLNFYVNEFFFGRQTRDSRLLIGDNHSGYSRDVLTQIRTCAALKKIKGLKSLVLRFAWRGEHDVNISIKHGGLTYQWGLVQLSAEAKGPYFDLGNDLEKAVLAPKALMRADRNDV